MCIDQLGQWISSPQVFIAILSRYARHDSFVICLIDLHNLRPQFDLRSYIKRVAACIVAFLVLRMVVI